MQRNNIATDKKASDISTSNKDVLKENKNIHLYNKDGSLNYNDYLLYGMSDKNKKAINKYNDCDGIISCNNHKKFYIKKKERDAINLNKERTEKADYISTERRFKEKGLITPNRKRDDDIVKDYIAPKKNPEDDIKKKFIDEQIINRKPKVSLNDYNEAQLINSYESVNRWGKTNPIIKGNTRYGYNISRLPQHHFGEIGEYIVDTLSSSKITVNGIEKSQVICEKIYNGQQIISRRFLCNILSHWCYITGIPYKKGIKIWSIKKSYKIPEQYIIKRVKVNGKLYKHYEKKDIKKEYKDYNCLSGIEGIRMIKDILFLTRNKNINRYNEMFSKGVISEQLYNVISSIFNTSVEEKTIEKKLRLIKDKVYYTYIGLNGKNKDYTWAFPKYNSNYLISVIKKLQSGEYYSEEYVPVINNLFKYPIQCKDTHLKQLTDKQHNKAKDDYDIGQYIWEDY